MLPARSSTRKKTALDIILRIHRAPSTRGARKRARRDRKLRALEEFACLTSKIRIVSNDHIYHE